jgi:hypothetical protein
MVLAARGLTLDPEIDQRFGAAFPNGVRTARLAAPEDTGFVEFLSKFAVPSCAEPRHVRCTQSSTHKDDH